MTKARENARKVMAWIWDCRCSRCGHGWFAFQRPRACAKCKSTLWDKPRVRRPKGYRTGETPLAP